MGKDEKGNYVFFYYDTDNNIVGIKHHKPTYWNDKSIDKKAKWFPSNYIAKYDPKKTIYI